MLESDLPMILVLDSLIPDHLLDALVSMLLHDFINIGTDLLNLI